MYYQKDNDAFCEWGHFIIPRKWRHYIGHIFCICSLLPPLLFSRTSCCPWKRMPCVWFHSDLSISASGTVNQWRIIFQIQSRTKPSQDSQLLVSEIHEASTQRRFQTRPLGISQSHLLFYVAYWKEMWDRKISYDWKYSVQETKGVYWNL